MGLFFGRRFGKFRPLVSIRPRSISQRPTATGSVDDPPKLVTGRGEPEAPRTRLITPLFAVILALATVGLATAIFGLDVLGYLIIGIVAISPIAVLIALVAGRGRPGKGPPLHEPAEP